MSSFSALEVGKRALMAQRFGIDVTSNNIANVNTPGYARRSALLSETSPVLQGGQFVGTGAMADKLRSFREEFFDREMRTTLSRRSTYENDEQIFQRIEAILAEPSKYAIGEDVTSFLNSFEELAMKPEDIGLRETILGKAQTLIEKFNRTSEQLNEARNEVRNSVALDVQKSNTQIAEIAELNKNISNSKSISQIESQTYVDQRELKLEELSELTGVTVTFENDGSANVFMNGMNIITGQNYNKIQTSESINSASGERTLTIELHDEKKGTTTLLNPQAGTIASNLKHYNTTLDPNDSTGFSVFKQLDDYVDKLAQSINTITAGGYGLDDTTGLAPGRTFFEPSVGKITAGNIKLSEDVKDKPRDIPFSSAAGEPGNAQVALAIGRIAQDPTFLNGQRPHEFYAAYIGKIGTMSQEATNGKDTTRLVAEQLSNQRESVIGVNTDEEAVNLIKFQKAFEASSRIINVTNELLSVIVNLGR